MDNLLLPENKIQLTALLNRHVVAGKIHFKDLKDGEKLKTMDGKEIMITISGGNVSVDDHLI